MQCDLCKNRCIRRQMQRRLQMQVPISISANAMRLLQKPIQLQNASEKANATKTTNARINISANVIRLMQKPMQLQI